VHANQRPASFDCEPPDRDDSSTLVLGAKPANPPPAANSVAEPGICLVGLKDALDSLTGRLNQRLWIELDLFPGLCLAGPLTPISGHLHRHVASTKPCDMKRAVGSSKPVICLQSF